MKITRRQLRRLIRESVLDIRDARLKKLFESFKEACSSNSGLQEFIMKIFKERTLDTIAAEIDYKPHHAEVGVDLDTIYGCNYDFEFYDNVFLEFIGMYNGEIDKVLSVYHGEPLTIGGDETFNFIPYDEGAATPIDVLMNDFGFESSEDEFENDDVIPFDKYDRYIQGFMSVFDKQEPEEIDSEQASKEWEASSQKMRFIDKKVKELGLEQGLSFDQELKRLGYYFTNAVLIDLLSEGEITSDETFLGRRLGNDMYEKHMGKVKK